MAVGGDGSDVQHFGAFVKGVPTVFERLDLGLSGGVRTGRNNETAGYGGVEFGVSF